MRRSIAVAILGVAGIAIYLAAGVTRRSANSAGTGPDAVDPAHHAAGPAQAQARSDDRDGARDSPRQSGTVLSAEQRRALESPAPVGPPDGYADVERGRKTAVPCWGIRGTTPEDFDVRVDRDQHTTGKTSVSLGSAGSTDGSGTLYQFANAAPLRGERVEFSADLRTSGVGREAGVFVRVDDANGRAVAIDDMDDSYGADRGDQALVNRSLSGDNDWTSVSVVLDVPQNAHAISYGVALAGTGKVWLDNAHLEVVGPGTQTTAPVRTQDVLDAMPAFRLREVPSDPMNLDFEPGVPACR